jgi:crotonobetainyl-CoA:carnitine CoA-transferase CaiB-like acyl-CoA transferase
VPTSSSSSHRAQAIPGAPPRRCPGKTTDYYWQLTSRNKRSLAIDLKQADGLAVLYRLLARSDVFVTNFPLPVRERLKIAASDLLPLNPRLIYASLPPTASKVRKPGGRASTPPPTGRERV